MRNKLFILLGVLALAACKPQIPSEYIQPDELEDILYDYHIADAMGSVFTQYDDTLKMNVYRRSVLAKYGYTEAQFDSTMVYYVRHAELIHKIYESLSHRIDNEASALGVATDEFKGLSSLSNTGDTANIWTASRTLMLTQASGFNLYSFDIKPDTSYRAGDTFMLNADAQFIYKDGSRQAVMVLTMTYANDSVVSRVCQMSSSMHYKLTVSDDKRLGIKRIRGYFFQAKNMSEEAEVKSSSVRMLLLSNISLVRMHTPEPVAMKPTETADSIKADSIAKAQSATQAQQAPQEQKTPQELKQPNMPPAQSVQPVPREPKASNLKLKVAPVPKNLKLEK